MRVKTKRAPFITAFMALMAPASAEAQKSGGSGVEQAGDNAADLISNVVGPILLVLIGVVAVGAFLQRNVGIAISAALIGLIAGLFIFDPSAAESAFKQIYEAIF